MILKPSKSQIESRERLSALGIYAEWYLRKSQLDLYDLMERERNPFMECARRFGKTTSIGAFVMEKLIENPGWIARWCFPFKNQAREILLEEIPKIQIYTPKSNQFKYQSTDSVFIHQNGSRIYVRGVNEDRGESARGAAANIIVCDEFGFWKEPEYIVRSVLLPQLEDQEGRFLIKTSTPPPDLGHKYYEDKERAIRLNRYIKKTIFDKESLSQEELNEAIEESGGIDSPAFMRERLCEPAAETNLLVVPEFSEENIVPDDYERPEYFTAYVGGDSGADDLTAILFAYYNFQKSELVIEAEFAASGCTTGQITATAKDIERKIWGSQKPKKRVYDADKQLIFDLYGEYNYPMQMADKSDKRAAIHDLRSAIGKRQIKVKESCKNTIRQLRLGMWKDEKKQDFQRSSGLGHLDCVAAALYLNRSINTNINPVPYDLGLRKETHHIPKNPASQNTIEEKLSKLFTRKG